MEETFTVTKGYLKDAGKTVIRLDYDSMDKLGLSTGDTVKISSVFNAIAKCLPLFPEDEGKHTISMNSVMRLNCGCTVNQSVQISPTNTRKANQIHLFCFSEIPFKGKTELESFLKHDLDGACFVVGNFVQVLFFGKHVSFKIIKTIPDGEIIVHSATSYVISDVISND